MTLLILGAVRRSPMQEWMLPFWDELRDAAKSIRRKLNEGLTLSDADAKVLLGLAVGSGLVLLGVMVFAGLLVMRM